MQNKKNIEELVQKALAEGKNFQYHEEDWKELASRLDEDERKKRGVIWWYIPRVAAIGLLLVGALWGYQVLNQNNSATPAEQIKYQVENPTSENTLPTAKKLDQTVILPDSSTTETVQQPTQTKSLENSTHTHIDQMIPGKRNTTKANLRPLTPEFSNQSIPLQTSTEPQEVTTSTLPEDETKLDNPLNFPIQENQTIQDPVLVDTNPIEQKNIELVKNNDLLDPKSDQELIAENSQPNPQDEINDLETMVEKTKKQKTGSKFSLSLGLNPMTTNSTLSGSSKLGFGGGVKTSYALSSKMTLSSGAYYSIQNHQTPGTDYQNIQGYWDYYTDSKIPNDVDAMHQVIEVPVQIEFQLNKDNDNKFYTITGVNNSWTFNEQHDFNFTEDQHFYGDNNSWTVKDDHLRLLNHVKLGVGYETSLSKKVTIGVEPFMNIPLKGTEWGQLNLLSKGVSFNFSLPKKQY